MIVSEAGTGLNDTTALAALIENIQEGTPSAAEISVGLWDALHFNQKVSLLSTVFQEGEYLNYRHLRRLLYCSTPDATWTEGTGRHDAGRYYLSFGDFKNENAHTYWFDMHT